MDTKFQTSFIPKRSISMPTETIRTGRPINIISFIATTIFVLSLIATAGIFGYERYLKGNINSLEQELITARESLDTETLNEFMRLDTRLSAAERLLSTHSAPSLLFDYLQNNTVRSVEFYDFNFVTKEQGEIEVTMLGRAESFNAVALQSDIFNRNRQIINPSFSDLNPDERGDVTFIFKASLSPDFIAHQAKINGLSYLINQ